MFLAQTKTNLFQGQRNLEMGLRMHETDLPANLLKRIEELRGREASYWEDELYSPEALTNVHYREALEKCFSMDPLGPPSPPLN